MNCMNRLIRLSLLLAGWLFVFPARAQLCQGSLGDPIVNISFGSGNNPGSPLSAAATSYQYVTHDCPNDGFYTVINRTSACFSNSWHSLGSDHTGNPNGYFMLINASQEPGDFYVDTVDVFCSNTTYEFAAWVLNMVRTSACSFNPIQPNLTFRIEKTDGTVLKRYDTGNIPSESTGTWKQFGFFFATPPGVNKIVLRLTNNAPGGCGNDLALDDITFRPCGPLLDARVAGNGTLKNLCEGDSARYTLTCDVSSGYNTPYFQWQESRDSGLTWTDIPGAHADTLNRDFPASTRPGTYQYRLSVSQQENINTKACRVNSNPITILVHPTPQPSASSNSPVCEKAPLTLSASGGAQYAWTGVNGFTGTASSIQIDSARQDQSGTYFVQVTTAAGCSRRDSTQVVVHPRPLATAAPATVFLCEGDTIRLTATGGTRYSWDPASRLSDASVPDPLAYPLDSTLYRVVVSNDFSCRDTAYIQVNLSKKPRALAGPDQYIFQGQSAQLEGAVSGTHIHFNWSPAFFMDDTSSLRPLVHPPSDAGYYLEVVSDDGCGRAADTVVVHVFKAVYVPNAFSPNNDGLNDTWNIPALHAFHDYEILVYNRWGQLVYRSTSIAKPWDGLFEGRPAPTGVYAYIINIRQTGMKLSGWVMLVR